MRNAEIGILLNKAAHQIDPDLGVGTLRRALNQLGVVDRLPDGRRTVPPGIVSLFAKCRAQSGYLYPRGITREKLLAAADAEAEHA